MCLVCARSGVTVLQDLYQGREAETQAVSTVGDRMGYAIRVARARPEAVRELDRMIVHLREQIADQRTRVLGAKRVVPFQSAQEFLPDSVVARMSPCAETCTVKRLGSSLKFAEQFMRSPTLLDYRS